MAYIYYGYILFMNKHALVSPRRVDRDHLIPSPPRFPSASPFCTTVFSFFSRAATIPSLPILSQPQQTDTQTMIQTAKTQFDSWYENS